METKEEKMPDHIVTKVGIFDAQVCSVGTYDEALRFIQSTSPAGTQNNWQKHSRVSSEAFAPVKCAEHPERTHYLFDC